MLSDQLLELVSSVRLQKALTDLGVTRIVAAVLAATFVLVAIDYGRMLWLRSKMVCVPGEIEF